MRSPRVGMIIATGPLSGIAEWVTNVIHALGPFGVGLLTALENLVPPIPSEVVLPLAGFLAGQGRFQLPWVIAAATIGSLVGALIMYAAGCWLGEKRLRSLIKKYGRFLLLEESDLDQAKGWFDRHGRTAVFLARIVPGVRSFISIPAGVNRMPLGPFSIFTIAGSAVWNSALILLGWWLGSQWSKVEQYAQYIEYGVLALLVAAIGWFVWQRTFRRQDEERAGT